MTIARYVKYLNTPWQCNIQHSQSGRHQPSHFHEALEDMSLGLNLILMSSPTEHKSLYLSPISVLNTADKSTFSLWSLILSPASAVILLRMEPFVCVPHTRGCTRVASLASMLGACGLDTIFNTCQASSPALKSDSSHWACGQLSPELLMTFPPQEHCLYTE